VPRLRILVFLAACAAALAASSSRPMAAEKKLGWSDTAELSYIVTGGNAELQTLGFKNTLTRTWSNALLVVNAGGVRGESTDFVRAVDENGKQFEDSRTSLTAESYLLNGRYDQDITLRFFWHAGAGWERDRFAGVENRTTILGGLGNNWFDTDELKWRTTYAATYTDQQDVAQDPNVDPTFVGARLSSEFAKKFGAASQFRDTVNLDANLQDSSDFRIDWVNSLTVSLTTHLALKVGLTIRFDNEPSFTEVDEIQAGSAFPPGTPTGDKANFQLGKTDSVFATSLVINY